MRCASRASGRSSTPSGTSLFPASMHLIARSLARRFSTTRYTPRPRLDPLQLCPSFSRLVTDVTTD